MKARLAGWAAIAMAALHRIGAWWLGEMSAMLRPLLTHRLLGDGDIVFIRIAGGRAHLDLPAGGEASFPLGTQPPEPALTRRIARADAIALVLPAAAVLRRTVSIPAAAARQLHAAIPFLVERHTPFQQAQARSAWRIVGRDHAARTMRVELAVTAAAPLAQDVAALQALKIAVSHIMVAGDAGNPRLDFHAHHRFRDSRFWLREPSRLLLAASLLLLLAGPMAVAVATHLQARREAAAAASIGGAQNGRALLERLRGDMAQSAFLAARAGNPSALATLEAVSRALSDEAWLFGFELFGTTLEVRGFTTNLPATVAQLQSLPGLDRLEFRSPVMHGIRDNRDRFDILLRLKKADHAEHVSSQPGSGSAASGRGDMGGMGVH